MGFQNVETASECLGKNNVCPHAPHCSAIVLAELSRTSESLAQSNREREKAQAKLAEAEKRNAALEERISWTVGELRKAEYGS